MKLLPVMVLVVLGACTDEGAGGLIPPKLRIVDIGQVVGEPIEVPATAKVATDFVVRITSAGCDLSPGGGDVEGVDVTPYELYFDPPRYDCEKHPQEFTTLEQLLHLRFDTPGKRTLWIHVLRDGEIMHIPRDVDILP
jgi:hypothetical protein